MATKQKDAKLVKVLSSNLRLLVLLRESLAANGQTDTPLYAAIRDQAQVTGLVLPNDQRMTEQEVADIRAQAGGAMNAPEKVQQGETEIKLNQMARGLPGQGDVMVLNPTTLQPR